MKWVSWLSIFSYQVLSSPIILLKQVFQDLVSSVYPPRRKRRLKRPRNYNVMRRMRRMADQAKADKIEKSYAFERYSSRMASIIGPPFVKNKVKRRKRRNERRFQKKKRHQEREPSWESELDFHPSQPLVFETFIDRFLNFDPRKVYQQLCTVNKLAFPSRKRKKKKRFQIDTKTGKNSRQRALIAASHLTGQDVSSTASVYQARNNPEFPSVIDSSDSVSGTPLIRDFRGPLQKCPSKSLDGLSSKTEVLGMGKVTWEVQDFYGVKRTITTIAYYVPAATIRIFSPKVYFDEQKGGSYHMEKGMTTLTLGDGTLLTFPYQPGSKLSMMLTALYRVGN
jgi:hypothetical protein